MRKHEEIALRLSVVMGAWFVYAGGLKIFSSGLDKFAVDIGNYKLVGEGMAVAAAYLVAWVEVVMVQASAELGWLRRLRGLATAA
jgi:hypothetical protein